MDEEVLLADLVMALPPAVRLQRVVQTLRSYFKCDAVALLHEQDEHLIPVAAEGLEQEVFGRRFKVALHPRFSAILAQREAMRFRPGTELPDPYDGLLANQLGLPLPVHDCMGVSLYVEGQRWGILTLDALQQDAFDETMRLELARHIILVEAAIRMTRLEEEVRSLRIQPTAHEQGGVYTQLPDIIGRSPVLQALLQELQVVATSDVPVTLLGETGVGKELFARYLHVRSQRTGPLIQVNCAALPESLAESELFGHVRGAFSGATSDRAGRFEAAEGGTLFLDEVGELPMPIQAKLLRALQNGEIQRLGEDQPRKVQVRIVAATNRNLQMSVREGAFRADLYHRLSVYPVPIPPLRERGQDILMLAGHFLELNRARMGLRSVRLSAEAEYVLMQYAWPGNVRELEHVISRAIIKAVSQGGRRTDMMTLSAQILDLDLGMPTPKVHMSESFTVATTLLEATHAFQRHYIQQALNRCEGNWSATARVLNLDPSNLHKLARRLGLR